MTGLAMMAQWRLTEDGGALAREAFETITGQVLMSAEKAEGT
jgi:hypothetical protein